MLLNFFLERILTYCLSILVLLWKLMFIYKHGRKTISILSNQNTITSSWFQSPSLSANLINYPRQVFFNKSSFLHSLFFSSLLLELMKLRQCLWNNGAIYITAGWREQIRNGNWGRALKRGGGSKVPLCKEISHYWWLGRKHYRDKKKVAVLKNVLW